MRTQQEHLTLVLVRFYRRKLTKFKAKLKLFTARSNGQVWVMNDARRCCITQYVAGSTTSNMHMPGHICKPWMNGFVVAYECVYGRVGNSREHAYATSSNVEYRNGVHINGAMRARDIGQWRIVEYCKSQRAIETSREQAIRHCWDTTKSIIGCKEPPYAEPHVRWCERSENKSEAARMSCPSF